MWGVFLTIYINQPLRQSTPKLPYGEPLVWEISRVVNYIFPPSLAVAAALPSPVILAASRPSVSAPRNTLVPSIFYVSPSSAHDRATAVRCWRGEGSPAQSDPILLFGPVFMFASVFSRCWPWTLLQQRPNPSLRKPCREEAPSSCRSHLLGTRSSSLPAWSPTGLQPERSPLFRLPHVHLPLEISFCMSPLLAMLHAGHPSQGTSVLASCCPSSQAS